MDSYDRFREEVLAEFLKSYEEDAKAYYNEEGLNNLKEAIKNAPEDKVYHPSHYNQGKFEVWDVIEDWNLDFFLGNVVKYIARAGHKNDALEDLKKAQNYLDEYIERLEAKKENRL